MIRKVAGIGRVHIRSFIFTKIRCLAWMKINGDLTNKQQGSTTLIPLSEAKDASHGNKEKVTDSAFGKNSASVFFLGAKESETESPVFTLPAPTK